MGRIATEKEGRVNVCCHHHLLSHLQMTRESPRESPYIFGGDSEHRDQCLTLVSFAKLSLSSTTSMWKKDFRETWCGIERWERIQIAVGFLGCPVWNDGNS